MRAHQRFDGGVKNSTGRAPEQHTSDGDQRGAGERQDGYRCDEERQRRQHPASGAVEQPA
jgi:hypothetical protein